MEKNGSLKDIIMLKSLKKILREHRRAHAHEAPGLLGGDRGGHVRGHRVLHASAGQVLRRQARVRTTGAALGIVGMASYAAAGLQNVVTGLLLDGHIVEGANGAMVHDYTYVSWFWLGAAVISFMLPVLNWKRKQQVIE